MSYKIPPFYVKARTRVSRKLSLGLKLALCVSDLNVTLICKLTVVLIILWYVSL